MELEAGMTPYSEGTFDCSDYPLCYYNANGRCIYRVARLRVEVSRSCHQDIVANEIECEADYAMGLL